MTESVFCDLREQLDQYSVGFPSTTSGVEMKLLEKLFTAEEARMYLNLSMMSPEKRPLFLAILDLSRLFI